MNKLFIAYGLSASMIFGNVRDHRTNEDLSGVKVTTSIDTTYTDLNGEFKVSIKDSSDTVKISFISYDEFIILTNP